MITININGAASITRKNVLDYNKKIKILNTANYIIIWAKTYLYARFKKSECEIKSS